MQVYIDGLATGLDHVVHLLGSSSQQACPLEELTNVSGSRGLLTTLTGKQLNEILGVAIPRDLRSLFPLGKTKARDWAEM